MNSDVLNVGKRLLLSLVIFLLGFGMTQGQSGVADIVVEEKEEVVVPEAAEIRTRNTKNNQETIQEAETVEEVIEDTSIVDRGDTIESNPLVIIENDSDNHEEEGEIVDFANEIIVEGNSDTETSIWNFDPVEDDADEDLIKEAKPVVVHRNPYQVQFNSDDLPLLSTVRSIDVTGGETSYCSMIARLNKQQFYPYGSVVRGLGRPGQISVGNATQLIQYGVSVGKLTRVEATDLEKVLEASSALAVDVYLYKAHKNGVLTMANVTNFHPKDPVFDAYLMQGHRLVMFRADDEKWYALDTIRGTRRTTPQPVSEYIKTPYNQTWSYYIHTIVAEGGGEGYSTKNRFDIYPYASSVTKSRSVAGPWSMVSLYDIVAAHQLDLMESSCTSLVQDDSFFWNAGMTQGGEGAYRYEEDRHIWKI